MDIWNEWMCRICQAECLENFECVFVKEATQLELSSLGILYEELFNLSIHRQPDQPQSLCRSCTDRLKEFYEFKTKAVESYEKFCKIYIKEIGDETTTPSDEQCTQDVSPEIKIEYEEQNDEEQIIKNSDMSVIDPLASIDMPSAGPKEEQIEVDREFVDADCLEDVEDDAESSEEEDQETTQTAKRKNTNSFHMFQCKDCKQILDTKRHLVKHRHEVHKNARLKCTQCPKFFLKEHSLNAHLRIHQGLAPYECEECKKPLKSKRHYKLHRMRQHNDERNHQCHFCGKQFITEHELSIHLRVHNDERPYSCDICDKMFRMSSHLTDHRYTHMDKSFSCHICGNSFQTPKTLKLHTEVIHSNKIRHKCRLCQKVFSRRDNLLRHMKSGHFSGSISIYHKRQTYTCEQCPKKFRLKEILEVHLKTHQGLPAYECEPCKKSFNQKYQYINHMNGHQNVRRAQCHLCGKGFLTQGDLKVHFRSHTDERRYECDICGKKFLANSHMVNHRFSHLGKTLECEYCQQKYTTPITLKTHIRSVHKNICPYSCKVCNKQFKRHHHLKAHMKTH